MTRCARARHCFLKRWCFARTAIPIATAIAFIADEVGFWFNAEQARNPDSEILAAARPALATLGGPLICVSSPYAKRGELWNAYKRDYGPDGDPKIIVINAPSRRMNPL
jgi:hypothetical protein